MPDETRAIEPALDDAQWRYWLKDRRLLDFRLDVAADHFSYDIHQSRLALMALANAALPDDDPRKITHADVKACRAFDFNFYGDGDRSASVEVSRADCEAVQALAAKLAALLPPEG